MLQNKNQQQQEQPRQNQRKVVGRVASGNSRRHRPRSHDNLSPIIPSYYALLFIKILLVLIILLWLAPLVTGGNRRRRKQYIIRNLRNMCQNENVECARLVPEESMNCVNRCMSPSCYARIYESNPLENGEIDMIRAEEFEKCVKEELKVQRMEEKRKKKRGVTDDTAESEM